MASKALTAEDFAFSRLLPYVAYQWPHYQDAPHHRLICRKLEAVERGEIKRLMIFVPPRHGKSLLASTYFPAWFLGRNPDKYVITATYGQDLADDFGRQVKNQIADPSFQAIFPGVGLADDSRAARRFSVDGSQGGIEQSTNRQGAYYAVGVGGPLTGRGAHLLIIDDPVRNRQDADSETVRANIKSWYTSTAYTRLMPGGAVVVIQCMTGDTLITLGDGRQKRLDRITPADRVLSWDGKKHVESQVSGVINNGNDQTYLIRTTGTEVRANARHPFLVLSEEGLKWIRTKHLKPGMRIVAHQGDKTQGGLARSTDAVASQSLWVCAPTTTKRPSGRFGTALHPSIASGGYQTDANGDTASISNNSSNFSQTRTVSAQSASLTEVLAGPDIGSQTLSPTITTKRGLFAACYATTATGSQDEIEIPQSWSVPSSTSGHDTDEIVSIEPFGVERVYDLSVEGTHNFVANGLWTHNTRWHEDDMSGWLLAEHQHEGWDIINLPAIAEGDDPLGRESGSALWPEQYDEAALAKIQMAVGPRDWSALYQQRPAPDSGDYFKREWIVPVDVIPPQTEMMIYGGSDYAVTADGGDYTVHAVVGVDHTGRMYLLDLWRAQASSDIWVDAFCAMVRKWKPVGWAEETGQIKSGVGPFLVKRMLETGSYVTREQFPTRGDKAVRAQSIRGRAAMQGLHVPRDAPWVSDLISEMMSFPVGVHDDQVDALGLVGQLMDRMDMGNRPKAPQQAVPVGKIMAPALR